MVLITLWQDKLYPSHTKKLLSILNNEFRLTERLCGNKNIYFTRLGVSIDVFCPSFVKAPNQ